MFISVNLSQLFICVFCETPLTFGDLSQRAAERCQPLILEVKCIIAQHNKRKWARLWEMELNTAQARGLNSQIHKDANSLHFQIKLANRSIGHLPTRQKGKHKHRHVYFLGSRKGLT